MATNPRKKTIPLGSFEKDLGQLERIIDILEGGELSLEESVTQFEQGMKLLKNCQKALDSAEKKISILVKENHEFQLENFEENRKK